ncbi:MAG: helix-turn-helix domain-containing protein [Pseudomonadota bacterium]
MGDMISRRGISSEANEASEETYLKVLGARVRERRAQQRLSRRALSEMSGVSERFIAHLESGEGNISVMRLKAITDSLGVTVAQILSDKRCESSAEPAQPPWRTHPNAIAELFRHADPSRQKAIVDILVGTFQSRHAA